MQGAGGSARWSVVVAATATALLTGCATPAAPAAPPSPPATPSPTAPTAARPPLAADLAGAVPVDLGGTGQWVIDGNRAFIATAGGIDGVDLTTGASDWHASFPAGQTAWDATPTVGLSADGATVHALRSVDTTTGAALELLSVDATTGAVADSRLVADPSGEWRVDLPPYLLAADEMSLVLADNPESGYQVGAISLPGAELLWREDDQGFAADGTVITRSGARDRLTGTPLWQAPFKLGPLLGLTADAVVVEDGAGGRVVWLDAATGAELASTAAGPESCVAAASVLVCLADGATGFDLASGKQLWSQPRAAQAVTTYQDWVYLWRSEQRGDVLAGRGGEPVVVDAELPRIRFGNEAGILVDKDGYAWVAR